MRWLWAALMLGALIMIARLVDEDTARFVLEMLITGSRP